MFLNSSLPKKENRVTLAKPITLMSIFFDAVDMARRLFVYSVHL